MRNLPISVGDETVAENMDDEHKDNICRDEYRLLHNLESLGFATDDVLFASLEVLFNVENEVLHVSAAFESESDVLESKKLAALRFP